MTEDTRKQCDLLREDHLMVCFEQGDHPDEITTAYSAGADALERIAAIDAIKGPAT